MLFYYVGGGNSRRSRCSNSSCSGNCTNHSCNIIVCLVVVVVVIIAVVVEVVFLVLVSISISYIYYFMQRELDIRKLVTSTVVPGRVVRLMTEVLAHDHGGHCHALGSTSPSSVADDVELTTIPIIID